METTIRRAKFADYLYIDKLRQAEKWALGFIPKARYEYVLHGQSPTHKIFLAIDNETPTGYIYAGISDHSKIWQVAIQSDARRLTRGLMLVNHIEQLARGKNAKGIKCRVACDIEANFFWRFAGFNPVALQYGKYGFAKAKRKRPQITYYKSLVPELFPEEDYSIDIESQTDYKALIEARELDQDDPERS